MMAEGSLSSYFKEQLLIGNVGELVAKKLVVRLVADNEIELQLLDEDGNTLVKIARTKLRPGDTCTVVGLESMFNVTLR